MTLNEPLDPRKVFVKKKYSKFPVILAFASGKGGVGKSTLSGLFSLYLAKKGYKVGLMDLDLYGPSSHVILGAETKTLPEEEKGVIPPLTNGVHFISVVFYSENKPLVMRGRDISDAVLELLTITNWPALDYLIFDMPPGMGDVLLSVTELTPAQYLVVSGPSKIAMESVEKLIEFLKDQSLPYIGLVENMAHEGNEFVKMRCDKMKFPYIGRISFYPEIEEFYGNPSKIISSHIKDEFDRLFENLKNRE